jgi:hypothetical protein
MSDLKATLYTYHGFEQMELPVSRREDGSLVLYFTKAVACVNADCIVIEAEEKKKETNEL